MSYLALCPELVLDFNQWVFTVGCFLVCVKKIPTLPRELGQKIRVFAQDNNGAAHGVTYM